MTDILLIPGLWNSGPEHWQSYWEGERSDCRRVEQSDWQTPRCVDWVEALDQAIGAAGADVVLAAHSLGCATVAHWAATAGPRTREKVRGALLVAPSDVEAPNYPPGTVGFRPMPLEPLAFATIVVASRDDIWVSAARAEAFARAWGSRFVDVGNRGHINSDSKLGAWPEGQALLASLGAQRAG
jgi:predicted alpha/beta hydrolase family esterase